ncbi:MAG: Glu-tRNA(Gln) amidotransferase subunit GatD, partial [Thermoplasmata archaeon]
MSYEGLPAELLKKANAEVGDTIELEHDGKKYRGIIMPHHGFSAKEILTLKLSSGYNIGIELKETDKIEVVKKGSMKKGSIPIKKSETSKPKVSMLSTGGTIASFVDYRTGAVHPALSADELAFLVPELEDICRIEPRVVFSILSENMRTQYWQQLALEVAKEFRNGAEGVIIPHGTDTMGYTASALSFMLRDLPGPVVLVGAQRSSDRPSSDAISNLTAAARVAVSDIGEVVVVMHGDISDTHFLVHRGTKISNKLDI